MFRQNQPDNHADDAPVPIPLTSAQLKEVTGGYGDGYTVVPGIEGKHTNIWTK